LKPITLLKNTVVFGLLFFLLGMMILNSIPESFAEPYWGNLKVDVEKSYRLEGPKADVIIIQAKITNNDNDPIDIWSWNMQLEDSQHREFSSGDYYDLIDNGHDVTERDCPFDTSIDLNPGLSQDLDICFEVPKENVEFTLSFYESDPDYCRNPTYGSCQEKHVRIIVNAPSPKSSTSSSPQLSQQSTTQFHSAILVLDPIPSNVQSGADITFSGKLSTTSGLVVQSATINIKDGAGFGTDDELGSVTTDDNGGFSGVWTATTKSSGIWNFYAEYSGQDNISSAKSVTHSITVSSSGQSSNQPSYSAPKDTTPPKILNPTDITVDAESQFGAEVIFKVLTIDETDSIVTPSCSKNSGSLFEIGETEVTCNAMDSSGNRAVPISFTITVNPLDTAIPVWVKTVASYWCDDAIDDASFVEGIQYLIDNNVITISVESSSSGSQEIPEWVKNNACWWSNGAISDDDFASGIEYLVKQGIINV
jgi:hypothetical protein